MQALADVQCVRSADFGKNDAIYTCRSHLGNVLKPGDIAYGFDLIHANFNEADLGGVSDDRVPDVVLVRKGYRVSKRAGKRQWKLKQLEMKPPEGYVPSAAEESSKAFDFEMFMRDLEEDPDMRAQVSRGPLLPLPPRRPAAGGSVLTSYRNQLCHLSGEHRSSSDLLLPLCMPSSF